MPHLGSTLSVDYSKQITHCKRCALPARAMRVAEGYKGRFINVRRFMGQLPLTRLQHDGKMNISGNVKGEVDVTPEIRHLIALIVPHVEGEPDTLVTDR